MQSYEVYSKGYYLDYPLARLWKVNTVGVHVVFVSTRLVSVKLAAKAIDPGVA